MQIVSGLIVMLIASICLACFASIKPLVKLKKNRFEKFNQSEFSWHRDLWCFYITEQGDIYSYNFEKHKILLSYLKDKEIVLKEQDLLNLDLKSEIGKAYCKLLTALVVIYA